MKFNYTIEIVKIDVISYKSILLDLKGTRIDRNNQWREFNNSIFDYIN